MIGRRLRPELRERAERHIRRLAKRLDATVTFSTVYADRGGEPYGTCDQDTRRTNGPPIRTALDYFVHLHELGHIRTRVFSTETSEEGDAWAYAAKVADPEIMATMTKTAWDVVGGMFLSYIQYEAGRQRRRRQTR